MLSLVVRLVNSEGTTLTYTHLLLSGSTIPYYLVPRFTASGGGAWAITTVSSLSDDTLHNKYGYEIGWRVLSNGEQDVQSTLDMRKRCYCGVTSGFWPEKVKAR